jgi:hypothetical protein
MRLTNLDFLDLYRLGARQIRHLFAKRHQVTCVTVELVNATMLDKSTQESLASGVPTHQEFLVCIVALSFVVYRCILRHVRFLSLRERLSRERLRLLPMCQTVRTSYRQDRHES